MIVVPGLIETLARQVLIIFLINFFIKPQLLLFWSVSSRGTVVTPLGGIQDCKCLSIFVHIPTLVTACCRWSITCWTFPLVLVILLCKCWCVHLSCILLLVVSCCLWCLGKNWMCFLLCFVSSSGFRCDMCVVFLLHITCLTFLSFLFLLFLFLFLLLLICDRSSTAVRFCRCILGISLLTALAIFSFLLKGHILLGCLCLRLFCILLTGLILLGFSCLRLSLHPSSH